MRFAGDLVQKLQKEQLKQRHEIDDLKSNLAVNFQNK